MNFTIPLLIDSIAGVLKMQYPTYPVYTGPNQQGTDTPCFFIFVTPSTITDEVGKRWARDIGIDIVFLQQRNIVNGNARIQEIQEYLDENLALFLYTDGEGESIPLHTYDRDASTEDQELHYKFHVRQRVSLPTAHNPMRVMEDNNVRIEEK